MPKKIKATTLATPEPPKLEDTSESSKKKPSKGATPTTPKPDPDDKKPAAKPTKGPKHLHDFVILGTPMDVETATRAAGAADKSAVVDDKKASGRTADDGLILVDTDEDEPEPPKRNGPVDMAYSPNKKAKGGKGSRPDKILVTLFSTGMALFQHTRNDEDVEAYQYDAKEDLKLQPDESTLKKKGFLGFVQIKDKDGNKKKCKNTQYPATGFVAKPFDSPKAMKLYSKNEIKATLLKLATEFASVRSLSQTSPLLFISLPPSLTLFAFLSPATTVVQGRNAQQV